MNTASLPGLFRSMELFTQAPDAVLEALAAQSEIVSYPKGMTVFTKGEPGDALYLILNGSIKVHDGAITLAEMHSGQCIGEIALIDEGPRSMSISAVQDSILARIDREAFFSVFQQHPQLMQRIVALLTGRLRLQTEAMVESFREREQNLNRLVESRTLELRLQTEESERLRLKAEEQMREAERQRLRAEQSERAEQQFLANMSHEIRTPMNAVIGMTRLLLQKSPLPHQLYYLHSIQQASESLLVIINDILDISKIQAGKLEMEHTSLSVAEVVERVVAVLRFKAEEKGLELIVETDPELPAWLSGDPVRLQQVLLNLAGNAVKFTEKGWVRIQVRKREHTDKHCRVRFAVADSGIGMTPDQLKVVFESFRQASGDTTRKFGGTGLGLSISKELVSLFGGSLQVKSEYGKGSFFWFDIDMEPAGAPVEISELPHDYTNQLSGVRILLAEDNAMNRVVAVDTLEALLPGVHIQTAENGLEAVEMVQKEAFDVVLMDAHMPLMGGLEATRAIRQLPGPVSKVPVIAFTASVTSRDVQHCLQAGMNGCIPKPFQEAELIQALLKATNGRIPPEQKPGLLDFFKKQAGDKPDRMRKYMALYLDSATAGIDNINKGIADGDALALHRAIHTLKPPLKMIGRTELAEQAQVLEDVLCDGEIPPTMLPELDRFINGIRETIYELQHLQ